MEEIITAVKSWLSLAENSHWLLIYDNYDNISLSTNASAKTLAIRKYIPESCQGCIIITTRATNIVLGQRIHVGKLDNLEESIEILAQTSERDDFTKGKYSYYYIIDFY